MKLAFSTNAYRDFSLESSILSIKNAGYSAIELMCDMPHAYPPISDMKISEIKNIIDKHLLGIMLSCVSPENYEINLQELKSLNVPFGFKINGFVTTKPKNDGYTSTFEKSNGNPNEFLGQRKDLTPDKMAEFAKKFKEAGATKRTPWHQDQSYYCVNGSQNISFWIPLDNIPKLSCPEFVINSHKWNQKFIPTKFFGNPYNNIGEEFEKIPDIQKNKKEYDIISWDLKLGDAIAFNFATIHGDRKSTRLNSSHW